MDSINQVETLEVNDQISLNNVGSVKIEVRNSQVTKLSNESELRKMTSHFELLIRIFLQKVFFQVTNSTT